MKSGSLLAKASFLLLVLILGCLIYLIMLQRERNKNAARERARVMAFEQQQQDGAASEPDSPRQQSFAPLRPRSGTNTVGQIPPRPASRATSADASEAPRDSMRPETGLPGNRETARSDFAAFAGDATASEVRINASLTGRVKLNGTAPPEVPIALDAMCARSHPQPMTTHHYLVGDSNGLGNVFVYVKTGASATPPPPKAALLDQAACEYQPYVLGVQVLQMLNVRNSDPFLHNVHTTSALNSGHNVGQPLRGQVNGFRFTRPEVFVKFKCDVHPWMFAYVGVVSHPWFAVTDATGKFTLPAGLPAGRYTIAVVHQKLGEMTQEISISENPPPLEFTFDIPEALTRAR